MERKKDDTLYARAATALAALLLTAAGAWDYLRLRRGTGAPEVSYVLLAVAVAVGCLGVLLRVFADRPRRTFLTERYRPSDSPVVLESPQTRRPLLRNVVELAVIGLLLLGWWIRGDPGIPADPPVIGLELLGALVLGASATRAHRRSAIRARNET